MPFVIQHIDPWFLIVHKPAGLNSEPDSQGHPNALDMAVEHLRSLGPLPGNFFAALPHRLDRPTSGLLIITLRKQALSNIGKQFEEHSVKKKYLAIVEGGLSIGGTLQHWLYKNYHEKRAEISNKKRKGWNAVQLNYSVIKQANNATLIQVEPGTGRYHQIRAQFAAIGHPIRNDLQYGAQQKMEETGISLHASELDFLHPLTEIRQHIEVEPPTGSLWAI